MISVKKQGPFEVFSRGVEEPWSIWQDGKPFKQVWTWVEVEKILSGAMKAKAQARVKKTLRGSSHAAKQKATSYTGRWNHRSIAQGFNVPEDVVRRIYAAVQTAKRQGLHGGYYADFVERSVGRKLVGDEYTVAARAKEHLGYDPPGGYGGPKPKGTAKEPPRARQVNYTAEQLVSRSNTIIRDILRRRKHPSFGWDESNDSKDRELFQQAANELDVAADLYEEAGSRVHAGTLRERAKQARRGDYKLLAAYD